MHCSWIGASLPLPGRSEEGHEGWLDQTAALRTTEHFERLDRHTNVGTSELASGSTDVVAKFASSAFGVPSHNTTPSQCME